MHCCLTPNNYDGVDVFIPHESLHFLGASDTVAKLRCVIHGVKHSESGDHFGAATNLAGVKLGGVYEQQSLRNMLN